MRWHRKLTSDRRDLVAFDDNGLIRKHPLTVHRHDVDVNKRSRWYRTIVGVHGERPKGQPHQRTEIQVPHADSHDGN